MKLRGEILVGALLVLFGFLALLSALFNIDFGEICWPSLLILIGIWIIVRPRMVAGGTKVHQILFGDFTRSGDWVTGDEELWSFISDVDLDFTSAVLPEGETTIKIFGFVGDVNVRIPEQIGFRVDAHGFVTEARVMDEKRSGYFFQPIEFISPDYAEAETKINLQVFSFVGEITIRGA